MNYKIKLCLSKITFLLFFVFSPGAVWAFQMSPAVATLEPTGIKAEQIYLLTNTGSGPAAIEFKVTTRQQRTDGSEIRDPAAHLFSVHPKQVVIPSGGTQKIRVKWLGGQQSGPEKAFRFLARQLPVKLAQDSAFNLNVTMNIEGAIYIKANNGQGQRALPVPNQAAPQPGQSVVPNPDSTSTRPQMLQVKKVLVVNTPQGKRLALSITNPAREHIILSNFFVQLSVAGAQPITLSGSQTGNMMNQNLLAGSTRNFIMPVPAGFDPTKPWQASIRGR